MESGLGITRPVGSLPPSKPPTGPAPPRRSVCAPGTMSLHPIAGRIPEGDDHVVPLTCPLPKSATTGVVVSTIPQATHHRVAGRSLGGPQPAVGHRHTGPE